MKKIAAVIIVLTLVLSLPLVFAGSSSEDYTATVSSESNIVITALDASFGSCLPNSACTDIDDSLNIVNNGNRAPLTGINASFTTNISTTYGLNNSASDVIAGTNFQLNNTALTATAASVEIIANSSISETADFNISAKLSIPAGQNPGSYVGTVSLSWTN